MNVVVPVDDLRGNRGGGEHLAVLLVHRKQVRLEAGLPERDRPHVDEDDDLERMAVRRYRIGGIDDTERNKDREHGKRHGDPSSPVLKLASPPQMDEHRRDQGEDQRHHREIERPVCVFVALCPVLGAAPETERQPVHTVRHDPEDQKTAQHGDRDPPLRDGLTLGASDAEEGEIGEGRNEEHRDVIGKPEELRGGFHIAVNAVAQAAQDDEEGHRDRDAVEIPADAGMEDAPPHGNAPDHGDGEIDRRRNPEYDRVLHRFRAPVKAIEKRHEHNQNKDHRRSERDPEPLSAHSLPSLRIFDKSRLHYTRFPRLCPSPAPNSAKNRHKVPRRTGRSPEGFGRATGKPFGPQASTSAHHGKKIRLSHERS